MMCRNPYISYPSGAAYGCGQCMPCRFNLRRVWMHRILLEAAQYEHNAFVTLTYDDWNNNGNVKPKDAQDWLKRLRKAYPEKIRYYLVGEYGDETFRPHYHAALFNYPGCAYGVSQYNERRGKCCNWCELVRKTWGKGNIMLGTLERGSAGYMAKYVTKKMNKVDDPRLNGRHPEFGRMSLRPGIGYHALWEISSQLMRYELGEQMDDVPDRLRHGMAKYPLGRYLRKSLRLQIGKDGKTPQSVLDKVQAEVQVVRESSFNSSSSFKEALVNSTETRYNSLVYREKLSRSRRRVSL